MNIRKINFSDFEEIRKLHSKLYSELEKKYVDLSDDNFETHPISLLLEEDGETIGYINGVVFGWGGRLEGYINDLLVIPEFRGKGYGKALIEKFEKAALKYSDEIYIFASRDSDEEEVDPTGFYEKMGYKISGKPWLVKILKSINS